LLSTNVCSSRVSHFLEVVPQADFSDPAWGKIVGDSFSIEVNMGHSDEVESFALHVRGNDLAIGVVAEILEHLNLRGVDPQSETSALFTPETAQMSLRAWRSYRDSVINKPS
jgi:hypothetical protein